jgi:hypothetical protein
MITKLQMEREVIRRINIENHHQSKANRTDHLLRMTKITVFRMKDKKSK